MPPEVLFGISATPAIIGLVEVLKRLGLPTRAAPAAAVLFGILAALAQLYYTRWPWIPAVAAGIALGLSASGLYAGAKTTFTSAEQEAQLLEELVHPTPVNVAPDSRLLTPDPTHISTP